MNDLLSIDDLGAAGIGELLDLSDSFVEVTRRDIPKIPALRGKTVVTLFYEDSTRTRLSFETAAKRLTADTMSFTAASSAVGKGESLLDTVRTIEAMGVDAMVVRHQCAGAPSSTPATAATSTRPRPCSTSSRCAAGSDPTASGGCESASSAMYATPASPAAA